MSQLDVVVVGGGIVGTASAYYLSLKGMKVALLDQYDIPNQFAASGDHGRIFRCTYGKDSFYTDLAMRSLFLWKEFQKEAKEELYANTGHLDLALKDGGYEDHSHKTLQEMKVPVFKLGPAEMRERYRIFNSRAFKFAVFHPDGGMVWAQRSVTAYMTAASRKGAIIKKRCKVTGIIRGKDGIQAIKDSEGKQWKAPAYIFAPGPWSKEVLAPYKLPLQVTRQRLLYFRPPSNQGRYRPAHCPIHSCQANGFYGFPVHIHGFMKIGSHKPGPVAKPDSNVPETDPKFERACRGFLKKFMPDLAGFTETEQKVIYYNSTPDKDFILDRLPDSPNAYVATGFGGNSFTFAPLIASLLVELISSGRSELNLTRFRAGRFKKR